MIWVLFSIANEYYQPPSNLEAWWYEKPSFEQLAKAMSVQVDLKVGDQHVGCVLRGLKERCNGFDYRLEQIPEGIYYTGGKR